MPFLTTALVAGGLAAAGTLGGAAIASSGAQDAAKTQSTAALNAAQIQSQDAQKALDFQKQTYAQGQQTLAPWAASGTSALANLDYLLGINQPGAVGPGVPATTTGAAPTTGTILPPAGAPRPGAPVQTGPGDVSGMGIARPGAPVQVAPIGSSGPGAASTTGIPRPGAPVIPAATSRLQSLLPSGETSGVPSQYAGQSFNSLVNSGDPNVSPNQQTTQQWTAQGIPWHNITTSDGRQVSIRTGSAPGSPGTPGSAGPGQSPVTPGAYVPPANLNSLVDPSLGSRGSLMQSYPGGPFVAPTGLTEQNDPGYQARLNLGETALNNSAAARGGLLTGGTARDIDQFAQDYASNEYGNVYNRALNTYGTNYNAFQQNQANQYNRLAALAGVGQTTAQQLATGGQNAANSVSNLLLTSGNQQASGINNAAAATASGYQNSGNIYGSALSGIGGNISNLLTLNSLLGHNSPTDQYPGVASWGG